MLLRAHELNDGGQLFQRQQYGIVPQLLPDAAEPDHEDVEDEPESDWDVHNADAPDDEDAGRLGAATFLDSFSCRDAVLQHTPNRATSGSGWSGPPPTIRERSCRAFGKVRAS